MSGILPPLFLAGLILSAPGPETTDFGKGEDAVLLEEDLEVDVHSPTSAHVRFRSRTQILTQRGVEMFDSAEVGYEPGVVIKELRGSVLLPSGKRIPVKKSSIFDRADFEDYALYEDSMTRTMSYTGVVPGSIVEQEYVLEVRDLVRLPTGWALQRRIPVRSMSITIRAPASMRLRVSGATDEPRYRREEKDGYVTHRWTIRDVPPVRREEQMPPFPDIVSWAMFTPTEFVMDRIRLDAADWSGVARFQWDLAKDRTIPAPEVAEMARSLTASLPSDEDKTRALFEFAQSKINYVAVELGIGGWQPHPNGEVFKYRYGDCKDKATLMIAMLKSIGLRGYPVMIRTRPAGRLDEDSPGLQFDHVIVAIPGPEGYLFLDPTDSRTPYGDLPWVDQGVPVLVVKEDGSGDFTKTPLMPPERNRRHRAVTASISPGGDLDGTYDLEAWGQRRVALSDLIDGTPTEKADLLEDMVALLTPGAVLQEHEVKPPAGPGDPIRVSARFRVPRFVTPAGGMQVITPHLARVPWLSRIAAYPDRKHPVFFPYLMSETSEVRLTLPAGRTLKKMPAGKSLEGAGLAARTEFSMSRDGNRNVLVVRRSITLPRREIPAAEYSQLRAFLSALAEEEAGAVTLVPEG